MNRLQRARRNFGAAMPCVLLSALTLAFSGCRSAKPPPPEPRPVTVAERLAAQAEGLSEQQNWPAAANEWKKAAEQFGLLNDLPQQAVALHNQGQAELEQAHHEAALPLFERASGLNRKAGRNTEWWRNQIGILQAEATLTNRVEDLEKRFEELSAKAKELKDPLLQALFLNELGLWQRRQKHPDQANATFQQAEQKFTQGGNATGVAVAISNRALVAEDTEKLATAENLWRNALGRFEKLADPQGIARALAGLGRSLLKQNKNLVEAEDLLRRAAENFTILKNESESKAARLALAECLKMEGKATPASTEQKSKP